MEAVDPKDTTEPTTEPIAKNTVPDELLENAVDVSTNQDGGVRKVYSMLISTLLIMCVTCCESSFLL